MSLSDRFGFSFPPPSLGDELLAHASSAKIWFYRLTSEYGSAPCIGFQIEGELPPASDQPAMVRRIAEHFCAPRPEADGCQA